MQLPPIKINTNLNDRKVYQIALGNGHSAAVLEDGSLYMWGRNNLGQLGNSTNNGKNTANPIPVEVTSASFTSAITQIALGSLYSSALLQDGSVYMWGDNRYGQLGFEANTTANFTPTKVTTIIGDKRVAKIAVGSDQIAVLLDDNNMYMWGLNDEGQLGNGSNINTSTPTQVISTNFNFRIIQIATGGRHSAAILEDGSLYMWGSNYSGQLGTYINNGSSNPNSTPTRVVISNFDSEKIAMISLGASHSANILEDDRTYLWGYNSDGQLGFTPNDGPNPTPTWMSQLSAPSVITANAAINAQAAVDNLWVDDSFSLDGFKSSFNLINILNITEQEITMDSKPTYDNATGTVTMNVKIKYFYNEDGLLVPDTASKEMTIIGFVLPVTEDQFQWWWIIVGIGGATIVGLGVWFFLKKHNGGYGRGSIKGRHKSRGY